jgi:hypothetical protein
MQGSHKDNIHSQASDSKNNPQLAFVNGNRPVSDSQRAVPPIIIVEKE